MRKDGGDGTQGGDGQGGSNTGSTDFRGQPRSNDTHESKTDPDSRLYRKGKTASELRFMGHTLMENRNGLIVNATVTKADGHAEREAAKAMINDARQAHPEAAITLGVDKGLRRGGVRRGVAATQGRAARGAEQVRAPLGGAR